ncbi:glycosyltransferase involved in cell wall biosynthesis [Cellulosimicrobium cellulans]|uniref:Glycosyl transferase n=1 Tax=Cellulosimicrobium cellulans TaxID=1710 RepID=A0A1Y0HZH8_CELCE|nr:MULTISPECIES: glycosyltransferase family 2 protein [Cellulosimicrobium]ARU53592.1 glycosyl transferase [Cellulosimicrobium cellulans]MBM7820882.1 glycosyltransferase involved in cell wall biosynthesis [Cellulosimicrobium cellulans]
MHEPDAATRGRPRAAAVGPVDDACLVVPLYNEGAVVAGVVENALATFPHVVCVDDGSSDDSVRRAAEAGATVLRHAVNLGQGAALQTGIEYARDLPGVRYLVTFDADGQHQVEDAAAMVDLARREDVAIVFGSRFLDARTRPGLLKRVVLRTAVWFTNRSTGLRLTDAHNGLRVIRVDAARQVELRQDRMAHASEIVLQLGRTGLPWREYPVHVLYTDYSRAKGQSLWNSVNILVDLVFK